MQAQTPSQTLRLLGPRLLVEPLPQARRSPGGIDYAPNYQDDRQRYRVLAVGPGRRNKKGEVIPLEIEPGDYILSPLYQGQLANLENGQLIIDAGEVVAVWKP